MIRLIGNLEYVGINGEGKIHLILSKKSQDRIEPLVIMLRELKEKDVTVDIKKLKGDD